MKRILLFLLAISTLQPLWAQEDSELRSLVSIVKSMRTGSQGSYNKAQSQLSQDLQWTTMTEIHDSIRQGECRPYDAVQTFKLNRLLFNVERDRKPLSSHGDMLNGMDPRYHYSLYELSLKSNATVTYTLKGRAGRQTFVLVPHAAKGAQLSVSIRAGGKEAPCTVAPDGVMTLECDTPNLTVDDTITITVHNRSSSNQSYVIINRNSQKP